MNLYSLAIANQCVSMSVFIRQQKQILASLGSHLHCPSTRNL